MVSRRNASSSQPHFKQYNATPFGKEAGSAASTGGANAHEKAKPNSTALLELQATARAEHTGGCTGDVRRNP